MSKTGSRFELRTPDNDGTGVDNYDWLNAVGSHPDTDNIDAATAFEFIGAKDAGITERQLEVSIAKLVGLGFLVPDGIDGLGCEVFRFATGTPTPNTAKHDLLIFEECWLHALTATVDGHLQLMIRASIMLDDFEDYPELEAYTRNHQLELISQSEERAPDMMGYRAVVSFYKVLGKVGEMARVYGLPAVRDATASVSEL